MAEPNNQQLSKAAAIVAQARRGGAQPTTDVARDPKGRFAGDGATAGEPPTPPEPTRTQQRPAEPRHADAQQEPKPAEPDWKTRFDAMAQHKAALEEDNRRFQAELKAAREERKARDRSNILSELEAVELPKDYEEWDHKKQMAWWAAEAAKRGAADPDEVHELKAMAKEFKLWKELGPELRSKAQLEAVLKVHDDTGGKWSPERCLAVAKLDAPDLFPEDAPAAEPAARADHQVQEPSRSSRSRAPADPVKDAYDELLAKAHTPLRNAAIANYVHAQRVAAQGGQAPTRGRFPTKR